MTSPATLDVQRCQRIQKACLGAPRRLSQAQESQPGAQVQAQIHSPEASARTACGECAKRLSGAPILRRTGRAPYACMRPCRSLECPAAPAQLRAARALARQCTSTSSLTQSVRAGGPPLCPVLTVSSGDLLGFPSSRQQFARLRHARPSWADDTWLCAMRPDELMCRLSSRA